MSRPGDMAEVVRLAAQGRPADVACVRLTRPRRSAASAAPAHALVAATRASVTPVRGRSQSRGRTAAAPCARPTGVSGDEARRDLPGRGVTRCPRPGRGSRGEALREASPLGPRRRRHARGTRRRGGPRRICPGRGGCWGTASWSPTPTSRAQPVLVDLRIVGDVVGWWCGAPRRCRRRAGRGCRTGAAALAGDHGGRRSVLRGPAGAGRQRHHRPHHLAGIAGRPAVLPGILLPRLGRTSGPAALRRSVTVVVRGGRLTYSGPV